MASTRSSRIIVLIAAGALALLGLILFTGRPLRDNQPIPIGAILPLTGPLAQYGQSEKEGILLAQDEVSSQSRSKARQFRIYFEDSKAQPKDAVTAANKLLAIDGVRFLLTALTPVSRAVTPIGLDGHAIQIALAIYPRINNGTYISQKGFIRKVCT